MHTDLSSPRASSAGRAFEVLLVFLRLGVTSFGGPIVHLGYFRREFVERRRWLDDAAFTDLVGLCQFLPGPASSQTGFSIGLLRAGWAGGLAAWCGFTLPSVLAMLVFAAIALTAVALLSLLTTAYAQLIAIAAGALLGLALCRTKASRETRSALAHPGSFAVSRTAGIAALIVFSVLLFGLPLCSAAGQAVRVFEAFYRSGALVFGGGHVVLPLLQRATVATG